MLALTSPHIKDLAFADLFDRLPNLGVDADESLERAAVMHSGASAEKDNMDAAIFDGEASNSTNPHFARHNNSPCLQVEEVNRPSKDGLVNNGFRRPFSFRADIILLLQLITYYYGKATRSWLTLTASRT